MTALSWIGTLLQIAGALALASRYLPVRTCYAIMGPGAAILLLVALARADWPQVVLMAVFCAINGWGWWRWRR